VPLDQRKSTRFHCTTHCQPLNYRNDRDSKGKDVSSSDIDMNLDTSILNNDNDNNDNGNNTSIRTAPNAANGMQGNLENIGGDPDVAKICEKQLDYVGAGTLGDIMSDPSQDDDDEKIRGDRDNHDTAAIDIDDETKSEGRKIIENQYVGAIDVESATGSKTKGMPADLASEAASRGRDTATKIKSGPTKSGLVTSTGGTLTAQYGVKVPDMSPLDRIALTANGNLQRIFSSFYDAPVHVHVDRCVKRESCVYGDCGGTDMNDVDENQDEAIWDRIVHLSVFDQVSVQATGRALILIVITVHGTSAQPFTSHRCKDVLQGYICYYCPFS